MTPETQELLKRLLRKEFDRIDVKNDFLFEKQTEDIMKVCAELGFKELVEEMHNDLIIERL